MVEQQYEAPLDAITGIRRVACVWGRRGVRLVAVEQDIWRWTVKRLILVGAFALLVAGCWSAQKETERLQERRDYLSGMVVTTSDESAKKDLKNDIAQIDDEILRLKPMAKQEQENAQAFWGGALSLFLSVVKFAGKVAA